MPAPVVAVVGPGSNVSAELDDAAATLGAALARAGVVIVCGGLGGVMEAVARGARSAGGVVVGVLPGQDRNAGNAWLSVAVATGMGEARNVIVVRSADAVVALGGEYGTLSEIAFALKIGRPVIGYTTWELAKAGDRDEGIRVVDTVEDAVDVVLAHVGGHPSDGAA